MGGNHYRFIYDARLGIRVPELDIEWHQYSQDQQEEILLKWEFIRGSIPDRVKYFEGQIMVKQDQLNSEEDFEESCRLNDVIAELASCINELNLWYRVNQGIATSSRLHR